MMHRLSLFISATLLLFGIAAGGLWIRSHWVQDLWEYQKVGLPSDPSGYRQFSFRSDDGVFSFERDIVGTGTMEKRMGIRISTDPGFHHLSFHNDVGQDFADSDSRWHGIPIGAYSMHPPVDGFYFGPERVDDSKTYKAVWAPAWLLVAILILPASIMLLRHRAHARAPRMRGFSIIPKAAKTL